MKPKAKPIPEGYHTLTLHLSIKDALKAIKFYKEAFGAQEMEICQTPEGKVMHAVIKIGNSLIMLADEFPEYGCGVSSPQSLKGTTAMLHLFVEDVDAAFAKALKAGAKMKRPVEDQFWGDRYGQLEDPFGHLWSLATHKVDMTKEEVAQAAEACFKKPAGSSCGCS